MKTFTTVLRNAGLPWRTVLLVYLIASTATAGAVVISNRIAGEMSEAALLGDMDALFWLIIWLTGVMLVQALASAVSAVLLARHSAKASYGLRAHFVRHFLRVPFSRIEAAPSGERMSIYANDIPRAEELVATRLFTLLADVISFFSAFIFLLFISPRITGIAFAAAIGMLVVQAALSFPLQRWSVRMSEKQAVLNAKLMDSLTNLSTVAAYNLEEFLEKRYMTAYDDYMATFKKFARALAVMISSMMTIFMSPLIVIFTVLALTVISGNMTLAEFIAFVTTIMVAAGAVMQVAQNFGNMATAAAGAKRLNDNTAALEELPGEKNEGITGEITFSNVSFTYGADAEPAPPPEPPKPKRGLSISFGAPPAEDVKFETDDAAVIPPEEKRPAVANANFTISVGSRVAIVGTSGSGKSTVLKLLLGLYRPTEGTISVGGQDAAQLSKTQLRSQFAYVPQDSFLFPESIGRNIAALEQADPPRLEKACAEAGILDFIRTLPEGFDSELTEAADNVSGGQKQRIAMARAFYKDAPVILFDEATASLDPATEAGILETLNRAAADKTVIMVAHRPQAIAACDTIIVMDDGRVAGVGTHAQLLADNAAYQKLTGGAAC